LPDLYNVALWNDIHYIKDGPVSLKNTEKHLLPPYTIDGILYCAVRQHGCALLDEFQKQYGTKLVLSPGGKHPAKHCEESAYWLTNILIYNAYGVWAHCPDRFL
jgi:hypothetical protein